MTGKQATNLIGVVFFLVVLGYILAQTWIIPAYKQRQEQQQEQSKHTITKERMDRIAKRPEVWGKSGEYDGWGNQMRYRISGNTVIFVSNGPDGEPDTTDDIIKEYPVPKKGGWFGRNK